MRIVKACLLDVYDTMIECDFTSLQRTLAMLVGVDAAEFERALRPLAAAMHRGELSVAGAVGSALWATTGDAQRSVVDELCSAWRGHLSASVRVYEDTIPFLQILRARNVRVVLFSNCSDDTRPLLEHLDLLRHADAVVLSCEVGLVKPSADMFRLAVAAADVPEEATLVVDDQRINVDAAAALGLAAQRLDRLPTATGDDCSARSLAEVASRWIVPTR